MSVAESKLVAFEHGAALWGRMKYCGGLGGATGERIANAQQSHTTGDS